MGCKGLPGRPPGITKRSRQGHEASTGGPGSLGGWWRGRDLRGSRGDLRGSPSDLHRGMRHLRGVPGGPGGPRARARFPAECCVSPPYRFCFRSLGDWWRGGDLRGSRGDLRGSSRDLERGMRGLRGVPWDPGGAQSEGEVSGRVLRQHTVSLLFPQPGRLVA
eukprot:gene15509-biopygen247